MAASADPEILEMGPLVSQQEEPRPQAKATRRRHTHKGRIIKQGYNRLEREDARRETARLFLSGITLDSHSAQRTETPTQRSLAVTTTTPLGEERVDMSLLADSSAVKCDLQLQFEAQSVSVQTMLSMLQSTTTGGGGSYQRNMTRFDSPRNSHRSNKRFQHLKKQSMASFDFSHNLPPRSAYAFHKYATNPENKRIAFTCQGHPLSMYSILPYESKKKRPDEGRTRSSSLSVQFDLEETVGLGGAREVSLERLLDPIWVTGDTTHDQSSTSRAQSPSPSRKPNIRPRTPGRLQHAFSQGDNLTTPHTLDKGQQQFPWLFFRDDHSPRTVILLYHPECIDNHDYFIGRKAVSLLLPSYQVSVIQYAPANEIKKEINKKFTEMFPHVRLSQTKLRSIKREMVRVGLECGMDSASLAHSHVYFEKMTMMGRVNKPTRKIVAGTCLLLAAKFSSDLKKSDISKLIEEITDKMRVSAKDLLVYEFTTLVALEFSLLTPVEQLRIHYDRIREFELS